MPSHRRCSRRVEDSSSDSEEDGRSFASLDGRRGVGKGIRKDRGRKDRPSRRKHRGRRNGYGVPYAYCDQAREHACRVATMQRTTEEYVTAHGRLSDMKEEVAVYLQPVW